MARLRHWLDCHLVAAFVVLTYAWTWGVAVPAAAAAHGIGHARVSLGALTLAGFAPSLVALVLLGCAGGRAALRDVWHRIAWAGAPLRWYGVVALLPLASVGGSLLVLPLEHAPLPTLQAWYTPLLGLLVLIPLTGLFEEIGWRGLMLDRLQRSMSSRRASVLVAAAWGPWHIPTYLRLMPEGARTPLLIAVFLVSTIPLSLLFAWVYLRTGRRLLPVIVLHAAIDASVGYFFAPLPTGELRPFLAWCAALWLFAGMVLWWDGRRLAHPVVASASPG